MAVKTIEIIPPTPKQAARILGRFEPQANGCLYWKGATISNGYGCVGYVSEGESVHIYLVHRVIWIIHNGPIPDGMLVLHMCEKDYAPTDQRYKRCGNIAHLALGTSLDNARDRIANGRERKGNQVGSNNGAAYLTEADVTRIHMLRQEGLTLEAIGNIVGTSFQNVSLIVHRKHWSHVQAPTMLREAL